MFAIICFCYIIYLAIYGLLGRFYIQNLWGLGAFAMDISNNEHWVSQLMFAMKLLVPDFLARLILSIENWILVLVIIFALIGIVMVLRDEF